VTVDDLYALPLNEFTAARNKLAKEASDKSIAKLKKPSVAAWALNQAARDHKGDVARFLHAAATARDAAGRSTLQELREAEADVRRAALAALGRGATQLGAVNELLAAAAADEGVGEVLRAGRLVGDEEPGELRLGAGKPKRDEVREARERKAQAAARKKREAAEAACKEADANADRLAREADEAEEKTARLRARADTAREKADRLKGELEALEE
jgi:hypothetical protein